MDKPSFSQRRPDIVFLGLPTVVHSLDGGCDTAVDYSSSQTPPCSGARVPIHGFVHRASVRFHARLFGVWVAGTPLLSTVPDSLRELSDLVINLAALFH